MYGGSNFNHSHHPHHHFPSHYQKGGAASGLPPVSPESAQATEIFEHFIVATTFKSVLHHYKLLCDVLRIRPTNIRNFYPKLKSKIRSWKAQAIWTKFDKRIAHKCYNHGKACSDTKALIIGCGPCGLRAAIEAQLLGAKVVVIEKRDRFSRNNVLHLWPFVIADLKALGAKKFYGKFCAGAIDHISIRQLQCILLKVALLLGVEVFEAVTFEELLDPPEDQSQRIGWHARFSPMEHPVNQYEFDVLISADGKRNTLMGFKRKEFRGKLAIAITANFINRHSEQEARVQEISGVAFIFNQKFFKDLYAATGIDLENIVYYKDETHYFVMTAKKHSLIDKGVILRDLPDTQQLLHPNNVDRQALCDYAREAADFSTGYLMPHLEFAVNHYGKPDIAMFDFTSMFAAENACRVVEKNGHKLLKCLVGDSLLEPFWPTGSGCARGFLSSFDACWATRSWAINKVNPLEVIAERESIYRLLAQTTPENLSKDYSSYTLEPSSRYPTVNLKVLLPFQVRHLFTTDEPDIVDVKVDGQLSVRKSTSEEELPRKRKRKNSVLQPETLLNWCQKQVMQHPEIEIENLSSSFKDGRVLCAIINRYRPDLIDFESLNPGNEAENNQLALDILEKEFGIVPVSTGEELSSDSFTKPCLMSFISQIHDSFRGEIPQFMGSKPPHKSLKGQDIGHLDLEDFPVQTKNLLDTESSYTGSSASSQSATSKIACRIFEEPKLNIASKETLQQIKKRRSDVDCMDANAYQRGMEIQHNREERLRKQKKQRELNAVRFIRSMRMLHCDVRTTSLHSSTTPSFRQTEDSGLLEYRKQCVKSMREKAADLERKIYFPDKLEYGNFENIQKPGFSSTTEKFTDKVRGLEAKFKGDTVHTSQQKPKDMIRAVGRLEKTDWNLCAIEKKIEENPKPHINKNDKERVPKWSKDMYNDKFQNIERRLRENGEDEERIAKYLDIDASLQRLERKLREGSTLETGLRGHNKVSNLASQLSSKLVHKGEDKVIIPKQARSMILPSSTSDLCYFCGTRVYLVERLSAEGKYFHRQCFKCNYCGALLRLGNYIYDRENRFGGKFFCVPHFGLTVRSRVTKRPEETLNIKDRTTSVQSESYYGRAIVGLSSREKASTKGESNDRTSNLLSPQLAKIVSPLSDRGATPERVEFENSVIEHSDEEEYLSEEEWTDRNFGASANELDDDDDDSDYSDLSDEEVGEELLDSPHQLTADETRRLAESWKRRYSNDVLEGSDHESLSDSELDDLSEEHGADGDESHTATEGDVCEGEVEEDVENDKEKREREIRKLEFNINVEAPPKAETSDSGSETEIASEEDSDTEIDTDSEFDEDNIRSQKPKEIPTIVINELAAEEDNNSNDNVEQLTDDLLTSEKEFKNKINEKLQEVPKKECMSQSIGVVKTDEGTERSASLTNLAQNMQPNPRSEQLKRLLHRTESTEAVSAYKSNLRRQYLLGNSSSIPKKSVSSADLGDRFKSFMDKISETQKKLNPAPEPSPAMQAFLNSSSISSLSSSSPSRSTTFISEKYVPAISLIDQPPVVVNGKITPILNEKTGGPIHSSTEESSDTSKSEEGKLFSFPVTDDVSNLNKPMPVALPSAFDYYKVPSESNLSNIPLREVNQNNNDTIMIDELSFPVHLEEETDNIVCVDAKNVCMIESLSPNTSKVNLGSIQDTLSANEAYRDSKLILGEQFVLSPVSEKIMDSISCEILSNKNNKNTANDSILLEDIDTLTNCSDIDIDECFDKLANDAMLEIDHLEGATVPSSFDSLTSVQNKSDYFFCEHGNSNHLINDEAIKRDISYCDSLTTDEPVKGINSLRSNSLLDKVFNTAGNDVLISNGENVKGHNSIKCDFMINDMIDVSKSNERPITNHELFKNKCLLNDSLQENNVVTKASLEINIVDKNCNIKRNTLMEIVDHKKLEAPIFKSIDDEDSTKQFQKDEHMLPSIDLSISELEKNSEEIQSPETVGLTEFDLSDWAEDIEATSFGVDELRDDTQCSETKTERKSANKNLHISKIRARIASLESLEDSDSALSSNVCKNMIVQSPTLRKPSVLNEIEQNIDYMDTSGSESSLEDNTNPIPFSYKKLQDETPVTTPILDAFNIISDTLPNNSLSISNNMSCKDEKTFVNVKSKSLESDEVIGDSILRSASEPHVLKERAFREENIPKQITPKRYEGYVPRFKDRVMPFSLARDSIDIRKCSTTKPLFTPSKEDLLQRQKNEKFQENLPQSFDSTGSSLNSPSFNYSNSTPLVSSLENSTSILSTNSSSVTSPITSSSKAYGNIQSSESSVTSNKSMGHKPKDGDVVKEMVLSRISKRSLDKTNRKGSKNILHLSFHSSNSSLFGSEPSLSKGILTPSSAEAGKSNKENEFSFRSDDGKIESTELFNISTVPSINNRSLVDLSEKSAKSFNNDAETVLISPRNILPATPLTHPEKFQRDNQFKKELFKSTPHLPSSSSYRSPVLLPTSPPQFSGPPLHSSNDNFIVDLSKTRSPIGDSQGVNSFRAQSESPQPQFSSRSENENSKEHSYGSTNYSYRDRSILMDKIKKDPEERLKELLAERKRKDSDDHRDVRLRNKDSCLQECLEEYRQKRNSAPIPQEFSAVKDPMFTDCPKSPNGSKFSQNKRHFHRPSLLELESMQVFSTSNRSVPVDDYSGHTSNSPSKPQRTETSPCPNLSFVQPNMAGASSFRSPSPIVVVPQVELNNDTPSAICADEGPKKSTKKSKDRERRRSLIQVFAGMFAKTDDKKKSPEDNDPKPSININLNVPQSPVAPVQVPAPKSPSVKERFSKLRLSRSKDKKKHKTDNKNRSASADIPVGGDDDNLHGSLSLPTSPSRTIFSFLSSPTTQVDRTKPPNPGPSSNKSGQLYHSSCIQEENCSEDEISLHAVAIGVPGSKDTYPSIATPSTRRQKAALRAAKQADQKRLRMAQEIQRHLEECEVMTRELEEKGIKIEKALMGETNGTCHDEPHLMKEWFGLVREKNELIRWQEELMIKAKELELKDRHVRLESELRQRMTCSESEKTRDDIDREGRVLAEIISVIEEKDALASQLEEERKRYKEEDKELEAFEARKILQQHTFQKETGV